MSVPSALTLEQIKDSILRYLKLEDDTTADADAASALRAGLVRLSAYPFKSLRETALITVTTDAATFTLPSDYNMAFSLTRVSTASGDPLRGRIIYKSEEDFDWLRPQTIADSGTPQLYTVRATGAGPTVGEFDFKPTTEWFSVSSQVRLRYYRRLDTIVTSSSTFSIPPEFTEWLIWNGRKEVASIWNTEKYPLAQQEANRSLADLTRRNTVEDEQDWY